MSHSKILSFSDKLTALEEQARTRLRLRRQDEKLDRRFQCIEGAQQKVIEDLCEQKPQEVIEVLSMSLPFSRVVTMCRSASPLMFGLCTFSYLKLLKSWLSVRAKVVLSGSTSNLDIETLKQFLRCIYEPTDLLEDQWRQLQQCASLLGVLTDDSDLTSNENFLICLCLKKSIADKQEVARLRILIRNTGWTRQFIDKTPEWFGECVKLFNDTIAKKTGVRLDLFTFSPHDISPSHYRAYVLYLPMVQCDLLCLLHPDVCDDTQGLHLPFLDSEEKFRELQEKLSSQLVQGVPRTLLQLFRDEGYCQEILEALHHVIERVDGQRRTPQYRLRTDFLDAVKPSLPGETERSPWKSLVQVLNGIDQT